jgi:rhodanese-related sulfurtransferase
MANSKLIGFVSALCLFPLSSLADDDGNRYNRDRQYASEISSADAYQLMMLNMATVLDVRSRQEYAAGHPERAYNIPYPRIDSGLPNQDPTTFYWEVYNKIAKGDVDRELLTLCRTGSRSIDAANILADPSNTALDERRAPVGNDPETGMEPVPFTNVRNIWEGFVGQYLYAFTGPGTTPDPTIPLDLNNNDEIDSDSADVYSHRKDANPDKDGWRNFHNLPWSIKIRKPLAYMQDKEQYECWQTDEGCETPPATP